MLSFFRKKKISQIISWIVLGAFLNLIQGCYYFKVSKSAEPAAPALIKLQSEKKFIVLHQGMNAWHFTNIFVGEDSVKGTITTLIGHQRYKTTDPGKVNRYDKKGEKSEPEVINEVHIYVNQLSQRIDTLDFQTGTKASVPVSAVEKIEIYDPATGATTASWILGTVGTIALATAVIVIIVALTKESCPFIYITDETSSRFVGEIYSGAIYPSLERPDYLPLPGPKPGQRDYTIRMTNEVHEIQNTNLIELNVFDHPEGTHVFIDKYGNYQTTGRPQAPLKAVNLRGENILNIIRDKDTLSYFGTDPGKDPALKDGIILTFKRPQNVNTAKLVVNANSTFWLDYIFTRFHELFGKEYDCWVDKQQTVPPEKMKTWMLDQNIPLSVYIEKKGKWQFVDYYNIVGPMAAKEDILSFNIPDTKTDSVRIKLEYGNLFWDVDYAAIDYTVNIPVRHTIAQFESAVDEQDRDVRNLLTSSDLLYYVQPEIGNAVKMQFSLPKPVDSKQTLILHSQGYYKILLNLTGGQQKKELLAFLKKGHFPEFSNEIFLKQTGLNAD
jgi:hypothetical protein